MARRTPQFRRGPTSTLVTALGDFAEMADAVEAEHRDTESGLTLRSANARIAANSFVVAGNMDGESWRVRVGPTVDGRTTLECHANDGSIRIVETLADRAVLEQARAQPVRATATFMQRRRGGGMRTRTVELTLAPTDGEGR